MFDDFPLFPDAASTIASRVDNLFFFLIAVCGFMTLVVFALVLWFALRYKRRSDDEIPPEVHAPHFLEPVVITIFFVSFMAMFVWGAQVFFANARPPDDSLEVWATGKQWMWRFQHIGGQSEINELHIPVGRPVKVTMISEDVIHSLFVPFFRTKKDVLPGRYTVTWFEANKTGRFHLYCTEYCGTQHSGMIGWVTVMEPSDYQRWAAGGAGEGSPVVQGRKLFESYGCVTCHAAGATARGPELEGLFGTSVKLATGETILADENYIRESIVNPKAKVVAGYEPVMPAFQGQLNEVQLMQLLAYTKSLAPQKKGAAVVAPAAPAQGMAIPTTTDVPAGDASTGRANRP